MIRRELRPFITVEKKKDTETKKIITPLQLFIFVGLLVKFLISLNMYLRT